MRTLDNQPCNGLRQAISRCLSQSVCYRRRKHLLISFHLRPRARAAAAAIFHSNLAITIIELALTIRRRHNLSVTRPVNIDQHAAGAAAAVLARLHGDCILNLYDCSRPDRHGKSKERRAAHTQQ